MMEFLINPPRPNLPPAPEAHRLLNEYEYDDTRDAYAAAFILPYMTGEYPLSYDKVFDGYCPVKCLYYAGDDVPGCVAGSRMLNAEYVRNDSVCELIDTRQVDWSEEAVESKLEAGTWKQLQSLHDNLCTYQERKDTVPVERYVRSLSIAAITAAWESILGGRYVLKTTNDE